MDRKNRISRIYRIRVTVFTTSREPVLTREVAATAGAPDQHASCRSTNNEDGFTTPVSDEHEHEHDGEDGKMADGDMEKDDVAIEASLAAAAAAVTAGRH
ncbi:unnamed protein product [Vitrella brassicaformis CCMP3155]|uniref:Uncharacterized protein n=1 Tax=Vitrella brassicaformis (strain CCMP3155) TaxID=1169540 RepID=A0A0G4H5P4_VITBC|nr:unnamed protein product [Vitrella brassicaformis CCMP3155]|eukprot:CEM39153.1 unnamed protein product [Vitrella brassicaformis CCMP3155]